MFANEFFNGKLSCFFFYIYIFTIKLFYFGQDFNSLKWEDLKSFKKQLLLTVIPIILKNYPDKFFL